MLKRRCFVACRGDGAHGNPKYPRTHSRSHLEEERGGGGEGLGSEVLAEEDAVLVVVVAAVVEDFGTGGSLFLLAFASSLAIQMPVSVLLHGLSSTGPRGEAEWR